MTVQYTSFIPNRDGLGLGLGTVDLTLIVFGLGPGFGLDQLALALSVLALLTSLMRPLDIFRESVSMISRAWRRAS